MKLTHFDKPTEGSAAHTDPVSYVKAYLCSNRYRAHNLNNCKICILSIIHKSSTINYFIVRVDIKNIYLRNKRSSQRQSL